MPLGTAVFAFVFLGLFVAFADLANAQLFDSLDAHPPRWNLGESDCGARMVSHGHLPEGGIDGRPCESVVFLAGHGTSALLVYPVEPTLALDQVEALLAIKSAKPGARVGLRIRYPYIMNIETRRPESVIIYGATYESPGEFTRLGVGGIEKKLKVKTIAIRQQYGRDCNPSSPYIDAVVVNAYTGPGTTSICLDQLSVEGMVTVGSSASEPHSPSDRAAMRVAENGQFSADIAAEQFQSDGADGSLGMRPAFPVGRVTKILQHNGEPLSWVKSLGFDAVLLSSAPNVDLLREAIRARVLIYAPPPSAPDPNMEPLLDPVAGWYIGSDVALDGRRIDQTRLTSDRLRSWPTLWQRPIVASPVEDFGRYAPLVDAMVCDAAVRSRGLAAEEEITLLSEARNAIGDGVEYAVGISTMPPESLLRQTQAIATSIGAPGPTSIRWHAAWTQVFRALETSPEAVLFRSTRNLSSGTALDSNRSMALSFINRTVAIMDPWMSIARPTYPMHAKGAAYHVGRLQAAQVGVILASSINSRREEILAGDGQTLEIALTPDEASHMYWRLTHFSAERLTPKNGPRGATLEIVSPDVCEIILTSRDPSVGARAGGVASRFARQATMDRWQLASDRVRDVDEAWRTAISMRAIDRRQPSGLVNVARSTIAQAEPLFRSGDIESSLRMSRRADAWAIRAEWQLGDELKENWPAPTSAPPLDCGSVLTQIIWTPLTDEDDWGHNRLTTGTLNSPDLLTDGRWTFGRRLNGVAETLVSHTSRGAFSGSGALFARSTPLVSSGALSRLPGGYAGTAIQIGSPSVHLPAGTTYRIDAMVKTLGFGDPHQGLLIYESTGGPEMGMLVRGQAKWTPIRIYRRTVADEKVSVMFELLGGGEVTIDEVSLRVWEPSSPGSFKIRPIAGDIHIAPIEPDGASESRLSQTPSVQR